MIQKRLENLNVNSDKDKTELNEEKENLDNKMKILEEKIKIFPKN